VKKSRKNRNRKQETGNRKQETGNRKQETGKLKSDEIYSLKKLKNKIVSLELFFDNKK
jgi:hypothetical protein